MKKGLTLIILVHFLLIAQGQFYYPLRQDASDFSKRTLLVQILEEDPAVLKKIEKLSSDKAEQEVKTGEYRELIKSHNDWIKQAVSKYWKVNEKIEFKTKPDIDELLKDIKILRKFAVLSAGWKNEYKYRGTQGDLIELYGLVAYVAEATDRHLTELRRGPDQKTDYIFKIMFPTDAIVLSDFIFAVQQFNFHISVAASVGPELERYRTKPFLPPFNKAGYEVIKQKTLMIPQESIPEDKKEELKIAYEYPFHLVSNRFLEEAIDHQFGKHCYVTMAWSDHQVNFAYFIVNASEGIILAELGHKPVDVKFVNYTLNRKNTDEILGDYKQRMGFSMNNIVQLNHFLVKK